MTRWCRPHVLKPIYRAACARNDANNASHTLEMFRMRVAAVFYITYQYIMTFRIRM